MGLKSGAALEKLKSRVAAVDKTAERKALIVIQINITDGGSTVATWTADLKNLIVTESAFEGTPDVVITIEDDVLAQIGAKTLTMLDAKNQGKVKLEGSPEALKLVSYLEEKIRG